MAAWDADSRINRQNGVQGRHLEFSVKKSSCISFYRKFLADSRINRQNGVQGRHFEFSVKKSSCTSFYTKFLADSRINRQNFFNPDFSYEETNCSTYSRTDL